MSISLKIKGNKYSSEGVGIDHVSIGDRAFIVNDRQYPPVARAGYGIVIQHYPDKSVYTMVIAGVSSVDGSRQGSLYIALSVPVGEYVKGLYNLLIALADFYRNNYLTPFGNGYRFADRKENEEEFASILAAYPVSHYPYRPVTNAEGDSVAYICAPVEDVAAILDDPMRGEFAAYSRVVLIPAGNPADATLSVPARLMRPYTLTVNGLRVSATVTDPDKTLNISVPETKTLQPATVRFSLNEARAGSVKGASVTVDDYAQTVNVNVHQQRKPQPVAQPHVSHPAAPGPGSAKKSSGLPVILGSIFGALAVVAIACLMLGVFKSGKQDDPENDIKDVPVVESAEDYEEYMKSEFEEEMEDVTDPEDNGDETAVGDESVNTKEQPKPEQPKSDGRSESVGRERQNGRDGEAASGSRRERTSPVEEMSSGDAAIDEAYNNLFNKLMLLNPMTKGDFIQAQTMLGQLKFSQLQKQSLERLISEHKKIHAALGQVKNGGAAAVRTALENVKPTVPGLQSYVADKLKLEDKDLGEFAVRFGLKRNNDQLY